MIRILFFILFCITLSVACKHDTNKSNTENNTSNYVQQSDDKELNQTLDLLEGTWRSLTDIGVYIDISKNSYVEYRKDGNYGKTHYFEIADRCKNDTNRAKKSIRVPNRYMSFQDMDKCFYITKLTPKELHLNNIGRGLIIKFKRSN